jgi:hypothetical protein
MCDGIFKSLVIENAHLIVVLHELQDDPDVVSIVFDGDDPHDVGGILRVRILAVLIRQQQARVALTHLKKSICLLKKDLNFELRDGWLS